MPASWFVAVLAAGGWLYVCVDGLRQLDPDALAKLGTETALREELASLE